MIATLDTPPPETLHRFTVAEYDRMIRHGLLTEDDRVELLDGIVVDKMPHNAPHDSCVYRLHTRLLVLLAPLGWVVRCQSAITLSGSAPEPDVAVVPGPESKYDSKRPQAGEVVLVIEVADSTLARDRTTKLALYARASIAEYWIVNLVDRVVEVYTQPKGGKSPTYRTRTDYAPGSDVPVVLKKKTLGRIAVKDVLP